MSARRRQQLLQLPFPCQRQICLMAGKDFPTVFSQQQTFIIAQIALICTARREIVLTGADDEQHLYRISRQLAQITGADTVNPHRDRAVAETGESRP